VGLTAVKGWAEVHRKPIRRDQRPGGDCGSGNANDELSARSGCPQATFLFDLPPEPRPASILQLVGRKRSFLSRNILTPGEADCGTRQAVCVPPRQRPSHGLVESILPGARIEQVSASLAPTIAVWDFETAQIVMSRGFAWTRRKLHSALGCGNGAAGSNVSQRKASRGTAEITIASSRPSDVPPVLAILRKVQKQRLGLRKVFCNWHPPIPLLDRRDEGGVAGFLIGRIRRRRIWKF